MKELVERIKTYALSRTDFVHYPPASSEQIVQAEARLGFPIPETLRECYLRVGNGGLYTTALGLIGLDGGMKSDYGGLVESYEAFVDGAREYGEEWPDGLLPFWNWGCNMFSCVACMDPSLPISTFEEGTVYPQSYNFDGFFELWLKDVDILNCDGVTFEEVEFINPFTRKKAITKVRKRTR